MHGFRTVVILGNFIWTWTQSRFKFHLGENLLMHMQETVLAIPYRATNHRTLGMVTPWRNSVYVRTRMICLTTGSLVLIPNMASEHYLWNDSLKFFSGVGPSILSSKP